MPTADVFGDPVDKYFLVNFLKIFETSYCRLEYSCEGEFCGCSELQKMLFGYSVEIMNFR